MLGWTQQVHRSGVSDLESPGCIYHAEQRRGSMNVLIYSPSDRYHKVRKRWNGLWASKNQVHSVNNIKAAYSPLALDVHSKCSWSQPEVSSMASGMIPQYAFALVLDWLTADALVSGTRDENLLASDRGSIAVVGPSVIGRFVTRRFHRR